jgi:hypothetical protein
MIQMAALEIKGYLSAWRELLFFLLAGLIIGAVLWLAASELSARGSLFEPNTVGVVDHDAAPELIFVYDFFNEYIIDLEFMEKAEAQRRLRAGEIPAFIELPRDFTRDVFQGINSPFTVHVSGNFPLQGSMVQLLASGGIAFLSASQAGVYATLGYAAEQGMTWEDIQRTLLIPVNMAFVQELIRHDQLFRQEMLPLAAGDTADYFLRRFVVFWHMLSLVALSKYLKGYSPGMTARFRLAGLPLWKMHLIRWSGLFSAVAFLSLPIMPVIGLAQALSAAVFVSAFGLLVGRLFGGGGGLFVFITALAMYFASGGIIPFVFLPRVLLPMRWLSLNYWAAAEGLTGVFWLPDVVVILLAGIVIAWFSFGFGLKTRLR